MKSKYDQILYGHRDLPRPETDPIKEVSEEFLDRKIPDDTTPIQPHVPTRESCHSYTDITTEMEESEYLWDGKKPDHDQAFHDYHIKTKE